MKILIPRLFYIEVVFSSREYVGYGGLERFLGSSREAEISRYRVKFKGIIVQEEGGSELHVIGSGDKIVLVGGGKNYCRWHSGDIAEQDNPLRREYCRREAVTALGYCNEHRDSLRAIYSKCFESSGVESLRNCWILDEKTRGKIEYALYLLAYSSTGIKVGATRYWRILNRIAEQPHVLATVLYKSDSAVKTRELEMRIGRLEGFTEIPHRSLREAIATPISTTIYKIVRQRDKIERVLRIRVLNHEIFRIDPGVDPAIYVKAQETRLENLSDKVLEVIDYYTGYLLLSDTTTNTYYILKTGRILHKNSVKSVK